MDNSTTKNSNRNQNNNKQIGNSYHPLPLTSASAPLNKAIKHDLFPEVTFCNLSIDELHNEYGHSRNALKHSIIAINVDADNQSSALTCLINGSGTHQQAKNRRRLISNDSGDSSIDSGAAEKKTPHKMPDGGYGWVVVFASLVVSLIADGLSFSFGLINTELLEYFGESASKTAWISSLFFSVPLLMGPIWSNLVDKYGCRRMTILGGVVSAFGFALSSLCTSIEMLMVTFGIISGLGLGIGYVTAVVSIAFWFDKKRSFATGIGASGTGIGTFVYARLTQYLIESYGWRGAILILGGTMLNACVCGALMRDPDWLIEENRLESRSQSVTTFSNSSVYLDEIKKLLDTGLTKEAVLDTLVTKNNTEANQQIEDPLDTAIKRCRSEIFLPTFLSTQELDSVCEVKSESRRSLRHKEGVEAPSRENLLSTKAMVDAPVPTTPANVTPKKLVLASSETLSSSKNQSVNGAISLNFDDSFLIKKNALNSRYSLNENIFMAKNRVTASIAANFRYNSVDILNNDVHTYYNAEPLSLAERKTSISTVAISIPNQLNNSELDIRRARLNSITGLRRLSKSKKPNQHHYHSNLRRQVSMRNSNFLKDMRIHRNSINYRGAMLNTHRYRLRASSCPNIYRNSMTTIAKEEDTWYDNFVDTIKSAFDFSLFLDSKFALFNLSTLFLFICVWDLGLFNAAFIDVL
ncbi:uncharacterized protein chk isoform X2 [Drosophila tropicalis]|uniref:uncharacterized protein chk isoform X2 n=1 Tax=Drosophila tropicalis TaxID=46794 RepID=UPI0035AB78B9